MDDRLLRFINREWTSAFADYVMVVFSSYDFWMPFLILAGLLVAWRGGFQGRAFLLVLGLTLWAVNFCVGQAKGSFDRPRPNQRLADVRYIDFDPSTNPRLLSLAKPLQVKINPEPLGVALGRGRSFPSGHTANLFAAATVCALCFRRGWTGFFAAGVTGYSRVYTGSHHPSDVLVTACFAMALALFICALLAFVWSRWGRRMLPALHARHPRLVLAW